MSLFGKIGKKMYREKYYSYQTQARGLLDKASLEKHFKKLEKWYWARLKSYLPKDLNANCLDAPCGYGNFLYFLRAKGYQNIQGFDLDVSQVRLAKLLDLPASVKDVLDTLTDSEDAYDLISSIDFIEHISKDEAILFLELCQKRINKNGVLIIRTPCADGPFGAHDANNDLTHQWSMTSNVLKTMLSMSGFSRVVMLDERPQPTSFVEMLRWITYFPFKMLANFFCMGLGMRPPTIWSRSMIAIAYK